MSELGWVPEEWRLLANLAALVEPRRSMFKSRARFGFALLGGGRFVLDPAGPALVSTRWASDTEVLILTNRRTLRDLLGGAFDPDEPEPEHLFLWAGSAPAFDELAVALTPGSTMIALRAKKH